MDVEKKSGRYCFGASSLLDWLSQHRRRCAGHRREKSDHLSFPVTPDSYTTDQSDGIRSMDVREVRSTFGLDLRSYPQEESRSCLANLAKNSAVELTGSRGEPTIVTLLIDIVSNCFLKV